MWLVLSSLAWGGECRWPAIETVSATMTTMTINGQTISVHGPAQWLGVQADLQTCGHFRAARELERWRRARQGVNTCVLLTAPTLGVSLWAGAPAFGITANERRERMVMALLND